MGKRLVRVLLEYDDGSKAEPANVKQWQEASEAEAIFCHAHGFKPNWPEFVPVKVDELDHARERVVQAVLSWRRLDGDNEDGEMLLRYCIEMDQAADALAALRDGDSK